MKLNLPPFAHKVQKTDGKNTIFDVIRKKYVVLTPEEWVRQHLIHYFINHLGYPRTLISVESGLQYNQLAKRSDIVVYSREGSPLLLAECKSFKVSLSDQVFEQSAIYNSSLKAPFLLISNGLVHYCCHMDYHAASYAFLEEVPSYRDMQLPKEKGRE
jgi:hypothetical protein